MPLDDVLLERSGRFAFDDDGAFLRDPRLEPYREWAVSDGRRAFAESLIWKSGWYLGRLNRDLKLLTASDYEDYNTNHVGTPLSDRPFGWLDPTNSRTSIYAAAFVWVAAAGAALAARRRGAVWFALLITVPVGADMYISYAADAIELGRHLAGFFIRYSVVVVVASAVMLDSIGQNDRLSSAQPPSARPAELQDI